MQIHGHTFLIAGGASGLGAATARRLIQHGGHVLIADLDESAGSQLAEDLGDHARFIAADVTDETQVASAIDAAKDLAPDGSLRAAINCAGIAIGEKLVSDDGPHRLDTFRRTVEINLIGTFNVMRLTAAAIAGTPPLEDEERGVIVNTASVAAFEGQLGQSAYAASKGAVASMTLPAARELARHGIRVVTIAPGIFDTPMLAAMPEKVRQSLQQQTVFPRRLGHAEEYAALAQQVIENPSLNGATLRLDGAIRLPPR